MEEEKIKLTAYNVRTKEKGVEMHDVVITKTAKNAYMAKGHDGKGNPLTTLLGREKAEKAVAQGVAKDGWSEPQDKGGDDDAGTSVTADHSQE